MLVVLVVSIVRKVAQSEWDCSLTKKKETRRERLKSALYLRLKKLSFLNMPRMYSWKALKTLSRHPKCAFHARYDWKITFLDWKQKNFWKFFLKKNLKKTSKTSHSAEKRKGGTLWDSLTNFLLQNIKKSEGGTLLKNWKFSKKKFAQCRKKLKGRTLWSLPVL